MPFICNICGAGDRKFFHRGIYLCSQCALEKLGIKKEPGSRGPYRKKEGPRKPSKLRVRQDQEEIDKRNKEIIDLRLQGKTMEETAAPFGITRERVRQILKKISSSVPEEQRRLIFSRDTEGRRKRERVRKRRMLRQISSSNYFQREEILRITGWEGLMSDLEICQKILDEFGLHHFGGYIHCGGACKKIKWFTEFSPKSRVTSHRHCKECVAIRTRQFIRDNPERFKKYAKVSRGRQAILTARWIAKKEGRVQDIPRLDSEPPPLKSKEERSAIGRKNIMEWRARATPEELAEARRKALETKRRGKIRPSEPPKIPEGMAVLPCECGVDLWDDKQIREHFDKGCFDVRQKIREV